MQATNDVTDLDFLLSSGSARGRTINREKARRTGMAGDLSGVTGERNDPPEGREGTEGGVLVVGKRKDAGRGTH